MRSYHDFHVYGFEVDSQQRKINFRLAWPYDRAKASFVNVLFEGVYGYELKNDSLASIVFDFEEIPLALFLQEHSEEIRESFRQNGAYHGSWAHNLDNAESDLREKGVKAIVLSSSMGLVGWVLAQTITEKNA